jgi:hypothetical protein
MKLRTIALAALFYVTYFALTLFLGGFALMWGSDYQWWAFAYVLLVPAALTWATVAVMTRQTR